MKGLAIVAKGLENIAAQEISELINTECAVEETALTFNIKKITDLAVLCYKAQSVNRVLLFISKSIFRKIDLSFINQDYKFRITRTKGSVNIIDDLAVKICDAAKKKGLSLTVDLSEPQLIFLVHSNGSSVYLGVDVAGFDLSKREYKVFNSPYSIKGTVAYSMIRFSGYRPEHILIDPFCRSGEIPIEAALYASGFAINHYRKQKFAFSKLDFFPDMNSTFEKLDTKKNCNPDIYAYDQNQKHLMQARKNAKIAGINSCIRFSRQDLDYLELKHMEKSVDRIVTSIPQISKYKPQSLMQKTYDEFFYQAAYILRNDGMIVILSKSLDFIKDAAKKNKFCLSRSQEFWSGKQKLFVGVYERNI
jgi:23S rRNA G2445 N2-methylase RlmL